MNKFDEKTIAKLARIAETQAKGSLPKKTYFIGMEGNRAIFGIRFVAPFRTGIPVFVKIGKKAIPEKIHDRDERFRLMHLLEKITSKDG